MEEEDYISRMPKEHILTLLSSVMTLLSKIFAEIDDVNKTNCMDKIDEITDLYTNPKYLVQILTIKIILNEISFIPEEITLMKEELNDWREYWAADVNEAHSFVANAELDILLKELGLTPNSDENL